MCAADAYNAQQMQPDVGNWEAQLMAQLKTALRADGKVRVHLRYRMRCLW